MRLPNGYGGITYLGKRRRKPYGVRISTGIQKVEKDGKVAYRAKYKYLGYFEKRSEALAFLADYNRGKPSLAVDSTKLLTFENVYDKWIDYRMGLNKKPSDALQKNWRIAFKQFSELHERPFMFIKTADYDACFKRRAHLSKSTVGFMKGVLHGMYDYALKYELDDYTGMITHEMPLSKFGEGLEAMRSGKALEVILYPDKFME